MNNVITVGQIEAIEMSQTLASASGAAGYKTLTAYASLKAEPGTPALSFVVVMEYAGSPGVHRSLHATKVDAVATYNAIDVDQV